MLTGGGGGAAIVVVALAELSARLTSPDAWAVAVLLMLAVRRNTIETETGGAAAGILPRLQRTWLAEFKQVIPGAAAKATKVDPTGMLSIKVTPGAITVPTFLTVSV